MAYQTGTTSGAADLLGKLATFASGLSSPWTIDDAVGSNKFAMHKNSVYVSFRYDATVTTGSQIVSVHQALGHTPGTFPGLHPDDSNSGYNVGTTVTGSTLDNERHVNLGLSANELDSTYYFFEQSTSPTYIHVVIAKTDGQHRHFGFGELDMFGSWTGGEYCYGGTVDQGTPSGPYSNGFVLLMDGRYEGQYNALGAGAYQTLHIESFPGQTASGKWAEVGSVISVTTQNDTAGVARMKVQGGYRGGPTMASLGNIAVNKTAGFINLIPIGLWAYIPQVDPIADKVYFLGYQPDVRGVIMDGISPGEELTIGSETWVCFPSIEKSTVTGTGLTLYQGVAYRKETA